ncbi:MAG: SpoIIE family protein phosphatase [bacterium]|nr:SpoIIE family protein phosphatase [bacterium]
MLQEGPSASVLVAQRDRSSAALVEQALSHKGYDVALTLDGNEAWKLYQQGRYGIVITGCDLPGLNGLELLRQIRAVDGNGNGNSPGRRYTYVVLTGGDAEDDELEHSIAAGADDFLYGPIQPRTLWARMQVAERLARMREDLARNNRILTETNLQLEKAQLLMRRELQSAARVQRALLPTPGLKVPGMEVAWRARPCAELGGDLLNYFQLDEHHMAFYVLDVSGHGVSSALLSVQVSCLMSPVMSESELLKQRLTEPPWYRVVQPIGVARKLNKMFQIGGGSSQYFTIVYGLLHIASGRLRLVSAGHPPLVYVPAGGEPIGLEAGSHPIGFFDDGIFREHELEFAPGDRLWLYSDGITEASNSAEQDVGLDGLLGWIADRQDQPLEQAVGGVLSAVEAWCEPQSPDDDCSLLAIGKRQLSPAESSERVG